MNSWTHYVPHFSNKEYLIFICVNRGYIETDILGGDERQHMRKVWTELTPMKRFGNPEELLGLVLFMASSLSSYMTGSDVIVDGGYTLW